VKRRWVKRRWVKRRWVKRRWVAMMMLIVGAQASAPYRRWVAALQGEGQHGCPDLGHFTTEPAAARGGGGGGGICGLRHSTRLQLRLACLDPMSFRAPRVDAVSRCCCCPMRVE
jgi:hypothetical protein